MVLPTFRYTDQVSGGRILGTHQVLARALSLVRCLTPYSSFFFFFFSLLYFHSPLLGQNNHSQQYFASEQSLYPSSSFLLACHLCANTFSLVKPSSLSTRSLK